MLCNSENISFCNDQESGISNPETLCVKLLKLQIDSPMENYLAPSVLERVK